MLGPSSASCYERFEDNLIMGTAIKADPFNENSPMITFSRYGIRLLLLSLVPNFVCLLSIFMINGRNMTHISFFLVGYVCSIIPIAFALALTSPYCIGGCIKRLRRNPVFFIFRPVYRH